MWLTVLLILTQAMPATGVSGSIGPRFHHKTGFGSTGAKGTDVTWGVQTPAVKDYSGAPKIDLPKPIETTMPLEEAIRDRHSVRSFANRPIPLASLSRLLNSACGITKPWGSRSHRSAPSAGALNPIEIYLVVGSVDSLPTGLYHYRPTDSSLELLAKGNMADSLHAAANGQACADSPPVALIIAARFARTTAKYADRGFRYVYMESGAVCQNVYLQATALNLGTVAVGAFDDDALNDLLGLDGIDEAALILMPVGIPDSE
jgi:SagB-type dehydrogenase family enzyme